MMLTPSERRAWDEQFAKTERKVRRLALVSSIAVLLCWLSFLGLAIWAVVELSHQN